MIRIRKKAEGSLSFCLFFRKGSGRLIFLLTISLFCPPSPGSGETPLSGFNPATLADARGSAFLEARAFGGNDVFALRSLFLDEWDGYFDPEDRNTADVYWKADSGIIHKGWRLAAFYRGELFMKANRDTVEIFRMINLKEDLPVGRTFSIDLNANGFSAVGVEISKGVAFGGTLKGLSAGMTARYLRGERIQSGKVAGHVTPESEKSYDFDLFLDYVYDDNYVYDRRDTESSFYGNGYSFDVGVRYAANDAFIVSVLFRDVLGRMYWRGIPYTTADATSRTKSFDEDGYQQFRPTIRGYESYKDYQQRIPLKTDIDCSLKFSPFVFGSTVNLIEDRPLYWFSATVAATDRVRLTARYNTNYDVVSAGFAYGNASFEVTASDISLRRARAVGLTASVRYEW